MAGKNASKLTDNAYRVGHCFDIHQLPSCDMPVGPSQNSPDSLPVTTKIFHSETSIVPLHLKKI